MPALDVAIRLSDVGKTYNIYDKPRDRLLQALWPGRKKFYREFQALSGIDLEILRGETIGVVGRNGSGKSTLLQLIAGVLQPSAGTVNVNGHVVPLLRIGGHQGELTESAIVLDPAGDVANHRRVCLNVVTQHGHKHLIGSDSFGAVPKPHLKHGTHLFATQSRVHMESAMPSSGDGQAQHLSSDFACWELDHTNRRTICPKLRLPLGGPPQHLQHCLGGRCVR